MKSFCVILFCSALTAFSALYQINVGTAPNDGTGDPARQAFIKVNANSAALDVFMAAANATNASQTAALSSFTNRMANAEATNASQQAALAGLTNRIVNTEATNAAQAAAVVGLTNQIVNTEATNAAQQIAIAGKQSASILLSNLLAMGISNIIAGGNAIISTNNGTLIINMPWGTNNVEVIMTTNLVTKFLFADVFYIGELIATNNVFISQTNVAASNGTNFVVDFSKGDQVIIVTNAVNFGDAINLVSQPTNKFVSFKLFNYSGANHTLAIPSTWRRALAFPSILTNATHMRISFENYGLSQTNIDAAAAQF